MMGIWFLGASVGNFLGGQAASFYESLPLPTLLGGRRDAADRSPASSCSSFRKPLTSAAGRRSQLTTELDMALDEYKRKRDFTKSPEPAGDQDAGAARSATGKPRFFCVQKHLASHLHYDFRLEHNGVLLSWAVPKGPSLDPTIKRLAMHVEDHPIEYGTFEGVIPEGYGAGIVMLWDQGTWTPEVDDVDAALAKGDLKFTLDGYKLKGSWVLVRTRGYGGNAAATAGAGCSSSTATSGPATSTSPSSRRSA